MRDQRSAIDSENVSGPLSTLIALPFFAQVRTVVRIGSVTVTLSPLLKVWSRMTNEPDCSVPVTSAPFTRTCAPLDQPGILRYSGKETAPGVLSVSVIVSLNG